jgi:hypothetical protein
MRTIAILLSAATCALAACGGDNESDSASQPRESSSSSSAPAPTTTAAGDTKTALAQCWRDAGAKIATSPADLRFAAGAALGTDVASDTSSVRGDLATYSFKPTGDDRWPIYFATPESADQAPSFSALLADPGSAVVAAYVNPADPRTVARADVCMSD